MTVANIRNEDEFEEAFIRYDIISVFATCTGYWDLVYSIICQPCVNLGHMIPPCGVPNTCYFDGDICDDLTYLLESNPKGERFLWDYVDFMLAPKSNSGDLAKRMTGEIPPPPLIVKLEYKKERAKKTQLKVLNKMFDSQLFWSGIAGGYTLLLGATAGCDVMTHGTPDTIDRKEKREEWINDVNDTRVTVRDRILNRKKELLEKIENNWGKENL